jgi:hypothetical protein
MIAQSFWYESGLLWAFTMIAAAVFVWVVVSLAPRRATGGTLPPVYRSDSGSCTRAARLRSLPQQF